MEQISCGVAAFVTIDLLSEEKHNADLVTNRKAHASIQCDPANQGMLIKDEDLIAINITITTCGSIDMRNFLFFALYPLVVSQ